MKDNRTGFPLPISVHLSVAARTFSAPTQQWEPQIAKNRGLALSACPTHTCKKYAWPGSTPTLFTSVFLTHAALFEFLQWFSFLEPPPDRGLWGRLALGGGRLSLWDMWENIWGPSGLYITALARLCCFCLAGSGFVYPPVFVSAMRDTFNVSSLCEYLSPHPSSRHVLLRLSLSSCLSPCTGTTFFLSSYSGILFFCSAFEQETCFHVAFISLFFLLISQGQVPGTHDRLFFCVCLLSLDLLFVATLERWANVARSPP